MKFYNYGCNVTKGVLGNEDNCQFNTSTQKNFDHIRQFYRQKWEKKR